MENTVNLSQVSSKIQFKDLYTVFEEFGKVVSVRITPLKSQGNIPKMGWVQFDNPESAKAAVKKHQEAGIDFYGTRAMIAPATGRNNSTI